MNKQEGMLLLEVLLAMSIFATAAIALISSMQSQRIALETLKLETLALWSADNELLLQLDGKASEKAGRTQLMGHSFEWTIVSSPSGETDDIHKQFNIISSDGRSHLISAWSHATQDPKEQP